MVIKDIEYTLSPIERVSSILGRYLPISSDVISDILRDMLLRLKGESETALASDPESETTLHTVIGYSIVTHLVLMASGELETDDDQDGS